jgi:esterase
VADLYHVDLGGAGLPPLLLLHGMLGSSRNWQTTGRDLAQAYHVFALDARNHGRSPHELVMNYEVMVADLIQWMDQQGLAQATIVGHSMGGKTAMLMACRHPERIQRLVVVDIAPKDYFWPAHREEFAALNELNRSNLASRQDAEDRFAARISSYGLRKFLSTNLEQDEAGTWHWVINLPALTAALPVMEKNCLQSTDLYRGPALFIAGANSLYLPPSDHELVLGHFPQARIAVIPDAGHNPHVEQRAAFVRQLLAV